MRSRPRRSASLRRSPASRPSASRSRTSRRISSRSATSSTTCRRPRAPFGLAGEGHLGRRRLDRPARMPHLLIAGTTGSGKSGCINALLTSILLRATPDEMRMILIDPKRIELNHYESVPHLLTPVVSSPKEAQRRTCQLRRGDGAALRAACVRAARNLTRRTARSAQRGEPTIPYLLVGDRRARRPDDDPPQAVEDAVIRLAQKSRAVGIHLVLATQRPRSTSSAE